MKRSAYDFWIPPFKSQRYAVQANYPKAKFWKKRNQKGNYGNSSSGSSGGPYRQLTKGYRHTNPRFPAPEIKYFDQYQTGTLPGTIPPPTSIPSTGVVFCINDFNQGPSQSQFVGNQVSTKSCGYRFEVALPSGMEAAPVPTSGRVCLVWDKQPNGVTAGWTDIFTYPNYLSFTNMSNRERFVILRNQQFSLSPQGDECLFFEGFCKINMSTTYQTTLATQIPYTGALLICYISDQVTDVNQPTLNGYWRTRYIDN